MKFIRLSIIVLLLAVPLQAAVNIQVAGTIVGDATPHADPTVTLPAHATGDLFVLMAFVRDVDDTATIITATGWAAVTGFPVDRGTTARYWAWWKVATSASETNPVIDFSGTTGDMYYIINSYRGNDTTAPLEVIGTPTTGTADPSALTTISSLTAASLIVVAIMGEDDNNAACTTTSTDPANYTEHYTETNLGADAVACFSEEVRAAAGATGTVNVDWGTAVPIGWGAVLMAVKPPPPVTCAQSIALLGVGCR